MRSRGSCAVVVSGGGGGGGGFCRAWMPALLLLLALVSSEIPRSEGVGMAAVAQGDGACSFTDPATGNHYDLTDMQHGKDYEKVVQMGLAIKFIYQFNICANTIASCGEKSGSSIETLQLSSGRNCRVLGKLPATFEALKVPSSSHNPNGEGVTIKYEDGDVCDPISRSKRTTIVNVECSTLESATGVLVDMKKDQNCVTKFRIMSSAGCSKRGLSHGSVFLVVLVIVIVVYLALGVFLMRRKGRRGWEQVPHREHWTQLPSLVGDGGKFVVNKVKGCVGKS